MRLFLLTLFIISCSGCWEVSNGERTGTIVKLTHEGIIFKTWGGEIIMGGVNDKGTPNIWYFGLDYDCKHPVTVKYSKELFVAPWRSSGDYMIYSIKEGGD